MKKFFIISAFILLVCNDAFARKPFKVAYFKSFPPFSWQENGEMKGIYVDVIDEVIQKRMGIEVSHKGYPWARAQLLVRNAKVDAMVTVPTPERRAYAIANQETMLKDGLAIFTYPNHPRINEMRGLKKIDDLKRYKIANYLGEGHVAKIITGWPNVSWFRTLDHCLELVKFHRTDLTVQSELVTRFKVKKLGYNNEIIGFPAPFKTADVHLLIGETSGYQNILPEFDRIIRQLKKNGTIERIRNKYR